MTSEARTGGDERGARALDAKRVVDLALACAGLVLAAPLMAATAAGILLASGRPILYHAERVGLDGERFRMLKFRTMRSSPAILGRISAVDDPRTFRFGAFLRRFKIDELPQLANVLWGEMSVVGPRPEDPEIVARHYARAHLETLRVRPGLTSPGSLYYSTHGERLIEEGDPERSYAERVLSIKLAIDTVYVRERSLAYDLRLVARTVGVLARRALGVTEFAEPPEYAKATALVAPVRGGETSRPRGDDALAASGGLR
jgi:lipopolysaccharide/colanic/teichoic acid biosynthesis glycosyltransferase